MFPKTVSLLALMKILLYINSHKAADAKPAEINGRIAISEIRNNPPLEDDERLEVQKREADYYDYDAETETMYSDYDEESDYWDSEETSKYDEVVQVKSVRPPDLPIDEAMANRTINLRVPTRDAPEYMLDLYEKFSNNKWVLPKSNIVRSFQNINEEVSSPVISEEQLQGIKTRIHTLVFNITSISSDEHIDLAKIRLYKLVNKDRRTYVGVDRKVSVFEVFKDDQHRDQSRHRLISAKHIYGRNSGWESFDVTSAVRRWVRFVNSLQVLEVRIETVFTNMEMGDMDIDTTHDNKRDPLLVVFSSEATAKRLHAKELQELISHEKDVDTSPELFDLDEATPEVKLSSAKDRDMQNNLDLNKYSSEDKHVLHRVKRARRNRKSRRNNSCRRKPMYVHFADINWNDWIIAPIGYQAFECTGRCYFPLSDHLTPTKHAIIQTLMHTKNSRKASRACCVPTKLDPMSILYIDQQGNTVFKYKYDGMIVAECGCR